MTAAQEHAIREICLRGLVLSEGKFRNQVTVADAQGVRLWHIQQDLIGSTVPELPAGWVQNDSGEHVATVVGPWRKTLFLYRRFPPWQWFLVVEGHWYSNRPAIPDGACIQRPEDAPPFIRETTESHLQRIVAICRRHAADKQAPLDMRQQRALQDIVTQGVTIRGPEMETQVTVLDQRGHRIYHAESPVIGTASDILSRHGCSGVDSGWFLDSSGYAWRQTLWRFQRIPDWNWCVLVEGHWYSTEEEFAGQPEGVSTMSNPHYRHDLAALHAVGYDIRRVLSNDTVLIVTGPWYSCELLDRSCAERLRDRIDHHGDVARGRRAVIVSDKGFDLDRSFRANPYIAVGGPVVNSLADEIAKVLPRQEICTGTFIALEGRKVALWGTSALETEAAVEHFVRQKLDAWLLEIWR
jgi:hypothetical protein